MVRRNNHTFANHGETSGTSSGLNFSIMDDKKSAVISAAITSAINMASLALSDGVSGVISAISPMVQLAIERGLSAIGAGRMSEREQTRIGSAVYWAAQVVEENSRAGRIIQQSQFTQDDMSILVESIFRAVSEDSQEKKEKAYGALLGNFAFQNKFDAGALFTMAKMLKEMSLDELLLIAALKGRPGMNYEAYYKKLDQEGDLKCGEMVGHFMRLRNLGIVVRVVPISLGSTVGNLKLSALGEAFCDLAKLYDIDPVACDALRAYLDLYAKPAGM